MNIMQPFYEKNLISTYDEKNVLYIGHIGKHDGETLFKLGKTKNIYTRDYEQHRKTFDTFNVIHIIECDNKDVVEQKFKNELKVKKLMRDFTTSKGKVQAEVFAESKMFSINDVINILNELVALFPLDALAEKKVNFKIKKNQNAIPVLVEKEKTLIEKEKTKQLELKNKKLELEIKKLELELNNKKQTENIQEDVYVEGIQKDIYTEFVDQYLEKTNSRDDYIVWTKLKQLYETWYSNNYHKTQPNAKEIKKYFEDNVFKKACDGIHIKIKDKRTKIRGWAGWSLIEDEDDD
jgi:hypothetical protein